MEDSIGSYVIQLDFIFVKKKTTTERRRETGNEEVSFRFVLEEGTILYKFWFIAQRESR